MRKKLGKKNCELSQDDIKRIRDAFLSQEESEHSKVFPNEAFGYWKVTVERPLRLSVELSETALSRFRKACTEVNEEPLANLVADLAKSLGPGPLTDCNSFVDALEITAGKSGVRMTAKRQKLLATELGRKDANAAPVIKKILRPKPDTDVERAALYGAYHQAVGGKPAVVEYEADSDLRDTEQVPFLEDGGVEAFFRRDVLPHAPDAWINEAKTVVGYGISFTRHFYKPQPLRTLEEIEADIRALEKETEGLLEDVLVGGQA